MARLVLVFLALFLVSYQISASLPRTLAQLSSKIQAAFHEAN